VCHETGVDFGRHHPQSPGVGSPDSALESELAVAIRAVPAWAGREPDAVTPLPGGLTNRNFRVDLGGEAYVVRIPGKDTALLGIDRRAEWEATRAAAAAGVGPEPVAFLADRGILVTRFLAADPLPAEALARDDVLTGVVTAIRTLHAMPAIRARFSPFRVVHEYGQIAAERGVPIPAAVEAARAAADEIERACGARAAAPVPCHNDLLSANFLYRDGRVFLVDYEYAGMGDPSSTSATSRSTTTSPRTRSAPSSPGTRARHRVGPWPGYGSWASCRTSARRCGAWSSRACPR
jgi:thiamine kinase-like enzyme